MGKGDRLRNRVEPFAALFLALGIVLYLANALPCSLAWHHSTAVHKACPYISVAEPKLFNFGSSSASGSHFFRILAPAPAPALYCHLKKWKKIWFVIIKTVLQKQYHQKYFSGVVVISFLFIQTSSKLTNDIIVKYLLKR